MKKKTLPLLLFLFSIAFLSGCFGEKLSLSELMNRGVSSAVGGDWKAALEYAERAVKVSPDDVNALILLALAKENTGDADGALDTITRATAVEENNYFAQYTRGRLLYEKKHFDSCIAPLRTALKLRPGATDPLILLAQSSVNLKDTRSAKSYYSLLARNRNYARNPAVWSELGMTFIAESDPQRAAQYLVYAYRLQPDNPKLLLNLGVYYDVYRRNRAEAVKYYTRFLNISKQNSAMAQKRGEVEKRLQALR